MNLVSFPLSLYLVEREVERDSLHMVNEDGIRFLSVSMMLDRSNSQQVMLMHYRCACSFLAPKNLLKVQQMCNHSCQPKEGQTKAKYQYQLTGSIVQMVPQNHFKKENHQGRI